MPSKNLQKCIPILQSLSKIRDPKKRALLLRSFEQDLIRAVREISYNLLNGNLEISDEDKKKLARYKSIIRLLASKRTKKREFRKVLTQRGKGYGFLLKAIPYAVSLIQSLVQ